MKRSLTLLTSALIVCASISAFAQGARKATPSYNREATELALAEALDGEHGEYAARALYKAITAKIGNVQPFVNILAAEETHIKALQTQWTKYSGKPVPPDTQAGTITFDGDILAAAEAGKAAEIANVEMYGELLAYAALYPSGVVVVFQNLQAASEDNHLAAFEALLATSVTVTAASGQTCPNPVCPNPECPKAGTGGKCQQAGAASQTSGTQDQLRKRSKDGSCLNQ